ncbi:LPS export ABC transporter periplasmic protein LptC [Roseivivax sp. CAU 1753]
MARGSGIYSQVVAGLKVLLPVIALGLLSTIFLFSRDTDPTRNLPRATVESLKDRTSETATGATYTGTTDSGAQVTMRAELARPDPDKVDRLLAEGFDASLDFDDGSSVRISAPVAEMDNRTATARMSGGVNIQSSTGYTMRTEALTSAMSRVEIESDGPVEAEGPVGTLTAGKLRITADESPDAREGDVQLLFTGGVRMVYERQQE